MVCNAQSIQPDYIGYRCTTLFVIDALYADNALLKLLGAINQNGLTHVQLFAPTAHGVFGMEKFYQMQISKQRKCILMKIRVFWDLLTGSLPSGGFYRFVVDVFDSNTQRWLKNTVTDPYSIGLSVEQHWSVFFDLKNDPEIQPQGWQTFKPRTVATPGEHIVYEVHVGDFSDLDESCPLTTRGKYTAFSTESCQGVTHLKALADAGMNTIHLLPTFNIASIPKENAERFSFFDPVAKHMHACTNTKYNNTSL